VEGLCRPYMAFGAKGLVSLGPKIQKTIISLFFNPFFLWVDRSIVQVTFLRFSAN
jgi:hypothetical protein